MEKLAFHRSASKRSTSYKREGVVSCLVSTVHLLHWFYLFKCLQTHCFHQKAPAHLRRCKHSDILINLPRQTPVHGWRQRGRKERKRIVMKRVKREASTDCVPWYVCASDAHKQFIISLFNEISALWFVRTSAPFVRSLRYSDRKEAELSGTVLSVR